MLIIPLSRGREEQTPRDARASPRAALPACPCPWLCTTAKIPANFKGLKTPGFAKQSVPSFLARFLHVRAAR